VKMLYEDVPDTLSQLIRTAFIPKDGTQFYVSDFSAIEARVIAWYAGETWRQKVFETGGDIYCASASQMFHVPVEKHGINGHLRQKGKIAELALGYGGSVGAHKATFKAAAAAGDEFDLLASTRECLKNGSATDKDGFFQYSAAGDSKHPITVEDKKSARIYVEFQEMQDGGDAL